MATQIRALLVEDSEDDALLVEHELVVGGFEPIIKRVETAEQMTDALTAEPWDVVISDYVLPRFSALEAYRVFRSIGQDLPFIIVSGKVGEDVAVEAMRVGVHDYITKDNMRRLAPAIKREIKESRLRQEHRRTRATLERTREEMGRQRQREQEMKLLGQLVSGVAHEVRNPLNAITALLEALFQELGDEGEMASYKKHIHAQVDRLNRLMQDLLELGKPSNTGVFRRVLLSELCAKTAELWNSAPNAGTSEVVFTDNTDAEGAIQGDRARLQQVLVNLIENASLHSPDGSNVDLILTQEDDYNVIRVVDRGTGIRPEVIDRIFDPFFTTRKSGTGLGLGIARGIVEAHGGILTVSNNSPGPGVTAEIRFKKSAVSEASS